VREVRVDLWMKSTELQSLEPSFQPIVIAPTRKFVRRLPQTYYLKERILKAWDIRRASQEKSQSRERILARGLPSLDAGMAGCHLL
jgi:hypothetical protein